MSEEIKKLKEFIYPNGIYSNIRSNSQFVKKYFPKIYENIKDNYRTKLYMLLHDIKEIPKCKNPNCNNKVHLKNISEGFRLFCCNACIGQFQKQDKEFAAKIKKTHKDKKIIQKKYPNINIDSYEKDKNYYIIKDYCIHGDIIIYSNLFNNLYKNNICLCEKCKNEIIKNYIPSEKEIFEFQKTFNKFYKDNSLAINELWFKRYYPKEYKIILYWSNHILNASLTERMYMFKNKLKNRPKCPNCKINDTHFNHSQLEYTKMCESYACQKSTSIPEMEMYDYIQSLLPNIEIFKKHRKLGEELDIYIPSMNIAFEHNGLFYHQDEFKDKYSHYNKWKFYKDIGIKLISIWGDEWEFKKDISKSIIKSKLGIIENKIYARKCIIKEINYMESKKFLKENHLQNNCPASVNIGLFYNNELVSLMTFGKRRMILKSKFEDRNKYELLRFCNKINICVVGGASKLFKYFIDKYNPSKIMSYANCDISDGNLYKMLNFKLIGHSGINYCWSKKKIRYHRSNFMKYKLVKEGYDPKKTEDQIMKERKYMKIWGTGNLKYEWIKN